MKQRSFHEHWPQMTGPAEGLRDAADLRLTLTGLVPPGGRHQRTVLFDEIEQRLPRDPQARVNVNLSELLRPQILRSGFRAHRKWKSRRRQPQQ